ncbi:MAG TPA: hypothetical protein VFG43_16310 [Geminicoccaceae bacterium]|nr:hypothetical protein [Geminicoccaceae bacterium]
MHPMSSARLPGWMAALGAALVMAETARAAPVINPPDRVAQIAGHEVALWLPPAGGEPHPLVLFSHGLGGCKTQSSSLMRALAEHGILVAARDHADSRCATERPSGELPRDFLDPSTWSETFHDDRRDDLQKLRTALEADPVLTEADSSRVALVGHSPSAVMRFWGSSALGRAGR